jgi:hypothetical protein
MNLNLADLYYKKVAIIKNIMQKPNKWELINQNPLAWELFKSAYEYITGLQNGLSTQIFVFPDQVPATVYEWSTNFNVFTRLPVMLCFNITLLNYNSSERLVGVGWSNTPGNNAFNYNGAVLSANWFGLITRFTSSTVLSWQYWDSQVLTVLSWPTDWKLGNTFVITLKYIGDGNIYINYQHNSPSVWTVFPITNNSRPHFNKAQYPCVELGDFGNTTSPFDVQVTMSVPPSTLN